MCDHAIENVVEYYILCNRLKDVIRTGWKDWNVQRNRLESVAEHIYGTQMLAIAMYSEFDYQLDLKKVLMMLAVHELEEIVIGDLTMFQISKEEKIKKGHEAVKKIVSHLNMKENLYSLILEFDERKTKEAYFAFQCDKLECDLQSYLYDRENCVDLSKQKNNSTYFDADVQSLLKKNLSFSQMWSSFSEKKYNYDPNFISIEEYIKEQDKQ